jgi:hypothetical protein
MSLGPEGALNGFVPSPNDAWHQNIANAPVDPMSTAITTVNGIAGNHLNIGFGAAPSNGIPYVVVDSTTQALSPITVTDYAGQSDITMIPIPANMPVEGSPPDCNTNYSSTGDAHAIILDRATCVEYEIAQADHCATTTPNWTGSQTTLWDFTETEQRPITWTSVDAAGLSVFEGLVRYDEIQAGVINHALRFTANYTKNDANSGYFIPPATHTAGNNWGTNNVMGMRIRLKASFDISGFSPTNQIILTAMKQYGMILADNGQTLYFQGSPDSRWSDSDLYNLRSVTAADFDVVDAPGNSPLAATYTPGTAPMYPAGNVEDPNNIPTGNAPINSLTASSTTISAGQSVTLTPSSSGASYSYIDNAGFVRGPVKVSPTQTMTYTLFSNNAYGSTASTPVTVTVSSISAPTLTWATIGTQTLGAAPFKVSATSNSTGAMTYSVLSGGATISGQNVTVTAPGVVTLQVSQAAAGSYSSATATTTFTVNGQTPTLSFSIGTQVFPESAFAVAATSNSTGTITYSVTSGPATISGNMLTLTGVGQVTVTANQAAGGNFTAGTKTAIFTVNGQAPTLSFSIPTQTFSGSAFAVAATSNSTGTITYSVTSGPATISGNMLTLTGVGQVTVTANQAAGGNFTAGSTAATFTVNGQAPTLSFSIPTQTFTGGAFAVAATSNSTGTFTYSIASGPATISGNMLTMTGVGQVHVTANQAAAGNFTAGSATATFTVNGETPTLSFSIPTQTFSGSAFAVAATSNSTGTFTYSIASGPATISGNMLTLTGLGQVAVTASQAAAGNFAAGSTTSTFTVNGEAPTLSFSLPTQTFPGSAFAVAATSNSMGTFTYSVASGPATISGNMLTLTGPGQVTVTSNQAAAVNFAAGSATATFTVNAAVVVPPLDSPQTILFNPLPNFTHGTSYQLTARTTSGLPVSYVITSGGSYASISNNVLTVNSAGGLVTVEASTPVDPTGDYALATPVTRSFNSQ